MKDIVGQEQIDQIALEWYRLSLGQHPDAADVFFKFVAVWVAFNALYASRVSEEVGDWNQVRAFAGEPELIDQHRRQLEASLEYRQAVDLIASRGVFDTATHVHRQIRDRRNLTQVASCLYQIRCNLFHGGKAPTDLRDRALVEAAFVITARLIAYAFKELRVFP